MTIANRRSGLPLHALLLFFCLAPGAGQATELQALYDRPTMKPLPDVLDDLEFAITERNFRITGRLSIGKAIREREGAGFPDYEVILFCNVGLARDMLKLEPTYVVFCPAKVAVRESGSELIITAPLLPEDTHREELNALAARINTLLRQIVDYGAETWPAVSRHNVSPQ
ncbi:MAG: DUF302 domain-containing protein [Gammaproteobacteria bacterium]|nr:DUF302 domain-containing protein [Gammaproteobacteria bacterium]